jgi:holliday junction DNA helicase RuvA
MISMLQGKVFDKDEAAIHIEVQGGIGYQVFVPQGILAATQLGQSLRLKIYTHVREDQIILFGFESKAQETLFHSLLKVNGVGPKVAVGILSSATTHQFQQMVMEKDIKGLSQLPKIGKKTAEQILLKLGELDWSEKKTVLNPEEVLLPEFKKLKASLINLGFPISDVQNILSEIDHAESFEHNFKKSLNLLSQL